MVRPACCSTDWAGRTAGGRGWGVVERPEGRVAAAGVARTAVGTERGAAVRCLGKAEAARYLGSRVGSGADSTSAPR